MASQTMNHRVALDRPRNCALSGIQFREGLSVQVVRRQGDRTWHAYRRLVAVYGPSKVKLVPVEDRKSGAAVEGTPTPSAVAPDPERVQHPAAPEGEGGRGGRKGRR